MTKRAGKPAHVRKLALSSWSAGYGATEQILRQPAGKKVDAVILLDSLHVGYVDEIAEDATRSRRSSPSSSSRSGRAERKKLMFMSHSSIIPPGYASTTETAAFVISQLRGKLKKADRQDVLGLDMIDRFDQGQPPRPRLHRRRQARPLRPHRADGRHREASPRAALEDAERALAEPHVRGIGVILNPRSKRNLRIRAPPSGSRARWAITASCGPRGRATISRASPRTSASSKIDVLGISGGDGTNHVTITGFLEVYADEPLPPLAFLRGGTMNTVANSVGVPRGAARRAPRGAHRAVRRSAIACRCTRALRHVMRIGRPRRGRALRLHLRHRCDLRLHRRVPQDRGHRTRSGPRRCSCARAPRCSCAAR